MAFCPPGYLDDPGLQVRLTLDALAEEIFAAPDIYPFEPTLDFEVLSMFGNWYMAIDASEFVRDGEPGGVIAASEIKLCDPQGNRLALDTPVCLIDGGPPGSTNLSLHFEIRTEEYHHPGLYRGHLRLLPVDAWGAPLPPIAVAVTLDVKVRIAHGMKNNQLYFHFGDPSRPQSAVIDGQLLADCPVQLMMMTEGGRVDTLPCRKVAGSLHQGDVAKDIRIGWRLQESGSAAWRPPDLVLADQGMSGWRLDARPGGMDYQLECTLTPEPFQTPGDYGQRILITIQPLL